MLETVATESPMVRYLLLGFTLLLLTACSELQVIGNAAVRELMAEGTSTEQLSHRSQKN